MKDQQPATAGGSDDGIDRKALRVALQRFQAISAARLERVRGMLGETQRQFVDLLPLLLHTNYATLPGYVSQQTPCGVAGYTPDERAIELARRVSHGFRYQRQATATARVDAVYIMGSPGSIGQSDGSDLDIWICYPEELGTEELALLQQKADRLQRWAAELRLDAHLFLMNGSKFQRGQREPLTGENCGTAQHFLLLDEFYRTGILLAGRHPAWWLVPPDTGAGYRALTDRLTRNRYVRAEQLVDFGDIAEIPAGEFVGGGRWQLYKAIDSPHKSVLKLLLFEVYVASFPDVECLSAAYKRAVFRGATAIDELDSYVMIYRTLEAYLLGRGEFDRLETVRRCLYYKAGKKLSRPPREQAKSWQRRLMERLAEEWGWDAEKLAKLDSRASWNIHEVALERNELVRELTFSYRSLSDFARRHEASVAMDARELNILGRKLYAAYERRAGKIEMLNPGHAVNVAEAELSICMQRSAAGTLQWSLHTGLVTPRGEPVGLPLKQAGSVTELLAWSVANGVIGEGSHVATREPLDGLGHAEVDAMVHELAAGIGRIPAGTDEAFARPALPRMLQAFVNVAADPLRNERARGVRRISNQVDSFGYSALRENLVLNVETVVANTWGELVVNRYAQEDGLVRMLRDYLQIYTALPAPERPQLGVCCFCASRADAIALRLRELLEDLLAAHDRCIDNANTRYVLAIESRFHLIQLRRGIASSQAAADAAELEAILAQPQREWAALQIDRHALRNTPLPLICAQLQPGRVAVFTERGAQSTKLTVVDERGSFFITECGHAGEPSLLASIDKFLAAVRYRQGVASGAGATAAEAGPPRYFALQRDGRGGEYALHPAAPAADFRPGSFLTVQAIAERDDTSGVRFVVYCEDREFSESALGEAFGARIAEHILSRRRGGARYPVYITDLDLSALDGEAPGARQTLLYLQHKARLEAAINAALGG